MIALIQIMWQPTKAELHEFTNTIDTKLKIWKCTKKSTKLYFRILIYKNYTLDELKFVNVCIKRRLCLYSAGNF